MTLGRLLLHNLFYHWRGNLAVLLGVVVGTAVLTGALLVGDSLRGSLRDLALRRLGWVDEALVAPRFFREALAGELQAGEAAQRVCPVILLQATAVVRGPGDAVRQQARGVTLLGVDRRFRAPGAAGAVPEKDGGDRGLWLNSTLARDLNVGVNDQVSLRLQKPSAVPRESLLGRKDIDATVEEWTLTVARVLADDEPGNRFSLRPDLEAPRTAFVPLPVLQEKLGQPGRVNALLAGGVRPGMARELHNHLRLEDWGLTLSTPESRVQSLFEKLDKDHDGKLQPREWRQGMAQSVVRAIDPTLKRELTSDEVLAFYRRERNYLSLESSQMLLEPLIADAALAAAKDGDLRAAPTLVYLANTIAAGGQEVPYSVVAALDPSLGPPLGPFLPPGVGHVQDDQIVLADWKESPLPRRVGKVVLSFFSPEHQGPPHEERAAFRLAGFVPLKGVTGDPDLTPEFPGITDKLSLEEWNPPFPYENKRVKPRDEQYWREYRTTPKAYVTLKKGQELWGSRFGRLTSIRLAPKNGSDLALSAEAFRRSLLEQLDPAKGGLVFDAVKENALQASSGGTDFAQLFVGFSFFLIAAALLLVGLLFRLNLDRRASEVGLLLAVGYRRRSVRWLLLTEGAVLAAVGVVAGCGAAIAYSAFLVQLLGALWPGGMLRSFLRPHFTWPSLVVGGGASFLVSVLTIAWAVRSLGRVPPRALLAGQATAEREPGVSPRPRWSWWVATVSAVCAVGLLACSGRVQDQEMKAMTFFGSGMLLLVAFLAALSGWMRGTRHSTVEGHGWWSVARLGVRNAARHPARSLLTTGLLASAAFLIVAVEAFRREVGANENAAASANGGFTLLAESDLPIIRDLNSKEGRQEILDRLLPQLREELKGDNAAAQKRVEEAKGLLEQAQIVAFRVHAGDDASCLNLYQPRRPRLLGVPSQLIDQDGFVFAATTAGAGRGDPWKLLLREEGPVPAFGEKNTVEWMLKSKLGGIMEVPTSSGAMQPLRIEGLLQDSVFQSSLLLSERSFLRLYPGQEGYNFFLIRTPAGKEDEVKHLLERGLAAQGFEVTPVARRLESYLAVENTYLSTFQALGGLGLILGSLGLAVVLLRGVWERRGELALLRALGYRRRTLGWLVLAENGFLLVLGLVAGTVAALAAVAPHVMGGAGAVPWRHLLELLALVLVVGLAAGALAVVTTLRAPLVPALRRE